MEQVIPHQQRRFEQLFLVKREKAEWRKAFKKDWKDLAGRTLNNTYLTDTTRWICGCPDFFTSRFLICKHLVQQKGVVDAQFFDQVHRHHHYPFLDTLSLLIENFRPSTTSTEIFERSNSIEDNDSYIYEELYG